MKLLEVGRVELENEHGARAEIYKSKNVYDKDVFIMDLMIKNEALPIPFYEIDKLNIYLKSLGFKDVIEKPFDLAGYLKNSLQPKEFKQDTSNIYLYFSYKANKCNWGSNTMKQSIGEVYFKENGSLSRIVDTLNENRVTPQQLKEVYKKLGWL